jgi:hypothetical protein
MVDLKVSPSLSWACMTPLNAKQMAMISNVFFIITWILLKVVSFLLWCKDRNKNKKSTPSGMLFLD